MTKPRLCIMKKTIKAEDIGKPALFPVYPSDVDMVAKLKEEKKQLVKTIKSRNPDHHKLIFGMAKAAIKNAKSDSIVERMNQYNYVKACMKAELVVEMEFNMDGSIDYRPKNINFDDMDEEEFQEVSDAVFKWTAHYLQEDETELRRNYKFILGEYI